MTVRRTALAALVLGFTLSITASGLAQETVPLERDQDYKKEFFLRQHFDQLLSPFEKFAFGKISKRAGGADEEGGRVPDFRRAILKIGQRTFCRTKLIGPGLDRARGAMFVLTTRGKSPFARIDRTWFEVHYAEPVGQGSGLANVIVRKTTTRGRRMFVLRPAGETAWYFSFTARGEPRGIHTHIKPIFFKRPAEEPPPPEEEEPVIDGGGPVPINICCIDVKENLATCLVPKKRSPLRGKPHVCRLFRHIFRRVLLKRIAKIRKEHEADECVCPVSEQIVTINGRHLPTDLSPDRIRIGPKGECKVIQVLKATAKVCVLKVKLLKPKPGRKDVVFDLPNGDKVIGEDVLEFTRVMLITPESMDFEENQFGAVLLLDTPRPTPVNVFVDGKFVRFSKKACQLFNITPFNRKSDTQLRTITCGGPLNAATFVLDGFCPGKGEVEACPEGAIAPIGALPGPGNGFGNGPFPGNGFPLGNGLPPPGNGGIPPEDFVEVCCKTVVKVLPVFRVQPKILVTACVLIDDFILPVPEIPRKEDGRIDRRALRELRRELRRDLFEKIKENTDPHLEDPGTPAFTQIVRLVGRKLPTDLAPEDVQIGDGEFFEIEIQSATPECITLAVTPKPGAPIGFLDVTMDFLGQKVPGKTRLAGVRTINDFPFARPDEDVYVGMRLHSTPDVIAAIGSPDFSYEWDGKFVVPAGRLEQLLLNVRPAFLVRETKVRARIKNNRETAMLSLVARGREQLGTTQVTESHVASGRDGELVEIPICFKPQDSKVPCAVRIIPFKHNFRPTSELVEECTAVSECGGTTQPAAVMRTDTVWLVFRLLPPSGVEVPLQCSVTLEVVSLHPPFRLDEKPLELRVVPSAMTPRGVQKLEKFLCNGTTKYLAGWSMAVRRPPPGQPRAQRLVRANWDERWMREANLRLNVECEGRAGTSDQIRVDLLNTRQIGSLYKKVLVKVRTSPLGKDDAMFSMAIIAALKSRDLLRLVEQDLITMRLPPNYGDPCWMAKVVKFLEFRTAVSLLLLLKIAKPADLGLTRAEVAKLRLREWNTYLAAVDTANGIIARVKKQGLLLSEAPQVFEQQAAAAAAFLAIHHQFDLVGAIADAGTNKVCGRTSILKAIDAIKSGDKKLIDQAFPGWGDLFDRFREWFATDVAGVDRAGTLDVMNRGLFQPNAPSVVPALKAIIKDVRAGKDIVEVYEQSLRRVLDKSNEFVGEGE